MTIDDTPREEPADESVSYVRSISVYDDAEDVKRVEFAGDTTTVAVGITDEVMAEFVSVAEEVFNAIHADMAEMREIMNTAPSTPQEILTALCDDLERARELHNRIESGQISDEENIRLKLAHLRVVLESYEDLYVDDLRIMSVLKQLDVELDRAERASDESDNTGEDSVDEDE